VLENSFIFLNKLTFEAKLNSQILFILFSRYSIRFNFSPLPDTTLTLELHCVTEH